MNVGETLHNSGNSYGAEAAQVQFAVAPQNGAVGTFFRGARRIQRVRFRNIEGVSVDLKLQQSPDLGDSNWVDVGASATVVPGGGEKEVDVSGLIDQPYARIYGGPTVANAGSAIVRATVTDLDLLDHFRQNTPYGAG
jgi:hypothetical protein